MNFTSLNRRKASRVRRGPGDGPGIHRVHR